MSGVFEITNGVFEIGPGAIVTLSGLTLKNGNALRGGILNNGTLTLTNSTVSGNSAYYGGGIDNGGRFCQIKPQSRLYKPVSEPPTENSAGSNTPGRSHALMILRQT